MEKRALVVGASGSIGRAIASRLAADGWSILAHGRDEKEITRTLETVRKQGGDGDYHLAELTDMDQVADLAEWAGSKGPLDAVIYSAGGGRSTAIGAESFDEWDRTLNAILHAPMRLTALTLPFVRQAQGGYLYICGMYAKMGIAKMAAHCAGRHGLEGFAKSLFEEVREDGVRVTLIHPGFVYSRLSNTETLDPDRMIHVDNIADMAALAVTLPGNACVTEMTVRPQRSPYR
ncbi:SDR family oxidoreductase [Aestuariispira ectoiniformans]|uniref:SDR family oxidoreductase n=1 Tax=Aestuariispira ectoiniformans TaxID=2775080 RepID=UPI00223C35A1|nr:SDR family oxidoreductase [Aestuariispira ectoiniformans]